MKLIIIFLNKIEYLDDLLSAFLEIGVPGATVLDSVGMGHIVSHDLPIFAGLRDFFAGSSPTNKTILIVTEKHRISKIDEVLKDVTNYHQKSGVAKIISVPVDDLFGFER
ncbi:MAG: P-II family nitrogen regulator [Acidobacteriota bacterium]